MSLVNNNIGWPWSVKCDSSIYLEGIKYPKISIVTPSFNQGQYIEETILSVINQNYPNLEYIIIDGGSTDNSVDIIKKYEKHLTYWVSEKDSGQSEAINKGILKATGEIFNWLNSDDYYNPGILETVAASFLQNNSDVVCGKCTVFGQNLSYESTQSTWFDVENNIAINPIINQPATFFKMSIIKELGLLNKQLHFCMDLEWWLKYLFKYGANKISKIEDVLVNFREHGNSKTVSLSEKFIEDKCLLYAGVIANKTGKINSIGDYYFEADLKKIPETFLFQLVTDIFFMGAVVFYGKRKIKKAKLLLSFIEPEYLNKRDQNLFSAMKIRLKYIPTILFTISDKLRKK